MARLVEVLYPPPVMHRRPFTLLRWWESRRPFYNVVVGATGAITLAGAFLLTGGEFNPLNPGVLGGVIAYGLAANVCYTFGWTMEILAFAIWGREAPALGPLLFRQGLIFSIGVTLLPLIAAFLHALARMVLYLLV